MDAAKTDHIKAFIAAQKDMEPARKAANNPHFKSKYADLATVQDACFPALHANGFGIQYPHVWDEAGNEFVETRFIHESGEIFSTRVRLILGKNDMQGAGSAITYARRYGLMSLAGIAPEDDDGNDAVKRKRAEDPKPNPASEGLKDAWKAGVLDSLPENATERQKAEAFAAQIEADFAKPKTGPGVNGVWEKRKDIIDYLARKHDDLHQNLLDAFSSRIREIEGETDDFGLPPAPDFPGDRVRA